MPCWNCGKSEGDSRHHFLFIGYGGDIHLRQCPVCKKTICQFCMSGGCPYCRHLRLQKIYERMRVYSCNYKGRIPLDNSKPQQSIALGDWFYDKSRAFEKLKEMVADKGFDLIYNLEYIRDTEAESTGKGGTYYRTIWSCECVAGFLRPQKTQKRGKK